MAKNARAQSNRKPSFREPRGLPHLGCPHGRKKGGKGKVVACASRLLSSQHAGLEDVVPSCQLSVAQCYLKPTGHFGHSGGIAWADWEFSPYRSCLTYVRDFPMIIPSLTCFRERCFAEGFSPAAKQPSSISLGCKGGIRNKKKTQLRHTLRNSV